LAGLLIAGATATALTPALAPAAARAAEQAVRIELADEAAESAIPPAAAITLKADDAPLAEVVRKIASTVPLALTEKGDAVEDPITLSLAAADWEDLILQLLSRRSYALIWDAASGRPSNLVVFWDAVRLDRDAAAAETSDDEGVEERIRKVVASYHATQDPAGAAIETLTEKRERFLTALRAYEAVDPNSPEGLRLARKLAAARGAYREALAQAANYDEARTVAAVLPTFDEDDAATRRSALETLRWLSLTTESPEALAAARASLVAPADKAEELAALEVLVRYGDAAEVQKLLEPIALKAGPNQERAATAWIRIRDEQAARAEAAMAAEEEENKDSILPGKADQDDRAD